MSEGRDIVSRLRRFASRASSPGDLVRRLAEEAFVRAWSHEAVRALARPFVPKREPRDWVFLVGCYNSGTTILQHILGAHPRIASLPREGVRFTDVLSNLELDGHHMMWADNYRDVIAPPISPAAARARIAADWAVFWKRGADLFFDKSVANAARVEWLDRTFGNARFIGIHRDGRCIAEGLHRRAMPPQWLRDKTGSDRYSLEATGRQWAIANEDMLDGLAKVGKGMTVRFESFVADPVGELTRIFAFLDIEAPPMDFSGRILTVAGRTFDIRDPNPSSLARLSADDLERLAPVIGPMMKRLGYEMDSP